MERDLLDREAGLGRRFQRKSRAMVDRCIGECQKEFLCFVRSRGFREGRPGPAYGENRLKVFDSRGSITLEIEDDPRETWSGPPRLKITVFRGSVFFAAEVCITRHFSPESSRSLEEMIKALPAARLSFTLCGHGSNKTRTFESFSALLASLGVDS